MIAIVIAIVVTPACLVVFDQNIGVGSCSAIEGGHIRKKLSLNKNDALENKITALEKELLSIDCSSTRVTEINTSGSINVEEWQNKKISTLENCWKLVGDQLKFRNIETSEISTVHTWSLCFNEVGEGNQTLLSNMMTCKGNVSAQFLDDGNLEILDSKDVQCNNNTVIFRREMNCTLDFSGRANCKSSQPDRFGLDQSGNVFELVRTFNKK